MTRAFLERCKEVQLFMMEQERAKRVYAKALLDCQEPDKIKHVVSCLEAELRIHKEVRTLWPYLLLIPHSEHTEYYCSMYDCSLEDLGKAVDEKISLLLNSLAVIDEKITRADAPRVLWQRIRERLINQVYRDAEILLAENV